MILNIFDTVHTFSDTTSFVESIFSTLGLFLSFALNFISNIPAYFKALIDFFITYVVELPLILLAMFNELPVFVQTGLTVILYAIFIAFIFRLIKLIVPFV